MHVQLSAIMSDRKAVAMNNKWNEIYPRPQLVRKEWYGLNGEWRFMTVRNGQEADAEAAWETINVPFCPESRLSGINRNVITQLRSQPPLYLLYVMGSVLYLLKRTGCG